MDTYLSVIIPCYNNALFLDECITSIVGDEAVSEIIIVDDASTDNSKELAFSLAASYPKITCIARTTNGGAARARLDGLLASKGNLIAFIDADDVVETGACADARQTLIDECADMCIWTMWRFDERRRWRFPELCPQDFPKSGRQAAKETLGGWKIHPLGVARRSLYEKAYDGFSESILNADELITRLVLFQAKKVSLSKKNYFYRSHDQSSTKKMSVRRLSTLGASIWLHEFQRNYPEIPPGFCAKQGIGEAWYFFRHRKDFGQRLVNEALREFLNEFRRRTRPLSWIWRYPKYFMAYVILSAVIGYRLNDY